MPVSQFLKDESLSEFGTPGRKEGGRCTGGGKKGGKKKSEEKWREPRLKGVDGRKFVPPHPPSLSVP